MSPVRARANINGNSSRRPVERERVTGRGVEFEVGQ
jgi:hypothetical protein